METLNINEHLEDYDYGEGHPERMIRLMQAVRDFNEENDRSYPAKVTAESYIQWSKFHLKDGGDDRAWSGGFADNH